jgi:hypothetical protein
MLRRFSKKPPLLRSVHAYAHLQKRCIMKNIDCLVERPAKFVIAAVLALMALAMSVIGVTILPLIGLLMAIPVFALAGFFAFSPASPECSL